MNLTMTNGGVSSISDTSRAKGQCELGVPIERIMKSISSVVYLFM